jgi:hypothetical protein
VRLRIDLVSATLAFIAFGLSYYAYVYFFAFDEGSGGAPIAVKAAKDVAYAVFLTAALIAVPWTTATWREWIFAPLGAMLLLVSLIHARHTGAGPQLIENIKNLAIYLPIFWVMFRLTADQAAALVPAMQRMFIVLALIQVIFAFGFYLSGNTLWLGGLFAGWIANPNSFALFVNLTTAALLAFIVYEHKTLVIGMAMALIGVMTWGLLHTISASQLLIHYALVCYCAVLVMARHRRALAHLAGAAAVIGAVSLGMSDRVQMSWQPIADGFTMLTDKTALLGGSISASGRLEMMRAAFAVLSQSFTAAMLGDFQNTDYHRLDGQFWVLLANGGAVTMLAFAVPALFVYMFSLRRALSGRQADLALHLMIVAFGAALLASRVLQYFPFNFLFFAIVGLALRPIDTRSSPG